MNHRNETQGNEDMGWTGEYNVPRTYAEEKRRIVAMFEWSADGVTHKVLQASNVRPNWYAAIEITLPGEADCWPYVPEVLADGRKRYVVACVILCKRYANEWVHKTIEEGSGPNESLAPASLLALLSPILPVAGDWSGSWAVRWRADCRENAARKARKLVPGMILRAPYPLSYGDYGACQTFKVAESYRNGWQHKKIAFHALDMGGMLVSLRPASIRACEIVTE
jgi:hypothetical protein